MRGGALVLVVLLAAACAPVVAPVTEPASTATSTATPTATPTAKVTISARASPAPEAALPTQSDRLLTEINATRARHGLGGLRADPRLAAAAGDHAADMATRDFFDHRAPDGSGLSARMVRAGYAYSQVAENIAGGHERAEDVVATWMLSEDHRRNLLNPEVADAGIGYVDAPDDDGRVRYRHYWVAIFGRGPR